MALEGVETRKATFTMSPLGYFCSSRSMPNHGGSAFDFSHETAGGSFRKLY